MGWFRSPIFPYRKALFADARPVLAPGTPYFSVDQGLELDSGTRPVNHPPLRAEGIGEAQKRLLVREDRTTLDPADVALVDAVFSLARSGEAEELPALPPLSREPLGLSEGRARRSAFRPAGAHGGPRKSRHSYKPYRPPRIAMGFHPEVRRTRSWPSPGRQRRRETTPPRRVLRPSPFIQRAATCVCECCCE